MWDHIAESYSRRRQMPWKDVKWFLDRIIWKPKSKVLDIGCGTGRELMYLSKRKKDKKLKLCGVDLSKNMLEKAKQASKKLDIKLSLKKADITKKLPYKKNSFDYVISVATLHHLTKKQAKELLNEIYKILKPKGKLFISVINKRQLKYFFKPKEISVKKQMKGKRYYRYFYFYKKRELKKLLKAHKFKIIKTKSRKNTNIFARKID